MLEIIHIFFRETFMDKKSAVIQMSKKLIYDTNFKVRHRVNPKYFTRKRVLMFSIVLVLILGKSVKS